MPWSALLTAVLVIVIALPVIRIWAWCVADLLRNAVPGDTANTALWLVMLIAFNVVGIILYVGIGPGRDRWDPDMLWWPWKR